MSGSARPAGLNLGNLDSFAWSYANADKLFPSVELTPGLRPPDNGREELTDAVGQLPALQRELATGRVSALTILHRGRLVYRWGDGHAPRLLMSVSKVVASLVLGRLIDAGRVDPGTEMTEIVPELSSQWAGCRVQHVWDMASGVECPEVTDPAAYTDPCHPFYRFEASLGWRPTTDPITPYELVCKFGRAGIPGSRYDYTSVNTFLLAWIIERVSGLGYAAAVQTYLWNDLALTAPARLCVSATGAPVAHGGIVMNTDDVALLAVVLTPSAQTVGHRWQVSSQYLELLHDPRPSMDTSATPRLTAGAHPACQWNVVRPDRSLFKSGFGGQGLYVDPESEVVIAYTGAPDPSGRANGLSQICTDLAQQASNG